MAKGICAKLRKRRIQRDEFRYFKTRYVHQSLFSYNSAKHISMALLNSLLMKSIKLLTTDSVIKSCGSLKPSFFVLRSFLNYAYFARGGV